MQLLPPNNQDNNTTQWRGFVAALLVGVIILASWLCPASRSAWDAIDREIFFSLNGSVATPSLWSGLCALLGTRIMDLLPLLLLLPFLLLPGLVIAPPDRIRAACHLLVILIIMLIVRTALDTVTESFAWRGDSPTRTLQPTYLLSEIYPSINPKDSSSHSFPGDHSGVLLIVASFLLLQRLNGWSVLASSIAVFFILPRLVAGAHWFSDVAVGGVFIASTSMAFGFFTSSARQWANELASRIYQHPLTPGWLR